MKLQFAGLKSEMTAPDERHQVYTWRAVSEATLRVSHVKNASPSEACVGFSSCAQLFSDFQTVVR